MIPLWQVRLALKIVYSRSHQKSQANISIGGVDEQFPWWGQANISLVGVSISLGGVSVDGMAELLTHFLQVQCRSAALAVSC